MAKKEKAAAATGPRVAYDEEAGPNGLRKPYHTWVWEARPNGKPYQLKVNPGDIIPAGDLDPELPPEEQPSERARIIKGHLERGVCRLLTD